MRGFRVYFDKKEHKFKCDTFKTEVRDYIPDDSTTSWFTDYNYARELVDDYNENNLDEIKICKDCGNPYWLMREDVIWFTDRGLKPPKRCKFCIKKRKNNKT